MSMRGIFTYTGLLVGAAALIGLAACAEKPTETPFPQVKPSVTITGIQISGGVTKVFANGVDQDGQVQFYTFNFDNGAIVVDSLVTPVYTASITYGSLDEEHSVSVTCIDNDDLVSAAATLTWTPNSAGAFNKPPDTEILAPLPGAVTGEGVIVAWGARDPDGSLTGYQVRFDEGAWVDIADVATTSTSKTGLAPGGHTVQVRAKDNFNVWDPTPASVSFQVQAGLAPELATTGVADGATFFVAPGQTVDLTVGWDANADYYNSEVEGYAYTFLGATSDYSTATEQTFAALGEGVYDVTVMAKDIGGNVAQTTISFTITIPTLEQEVLVVQGVQWSSYADQMEAPYVEFFRADDPAESKWQVWDILGGPAGGYPAGMDADLLGTGTPGGDLIGQYKCIWWLGQNYNGDLDAWNPALIAGYIRAGGKLLFAGRRTSSFFNDDLMEMAHITEMLPDDGGSSATGLQTTAAGTALGLQGLTYLTPSWGNGIVSVDGSPDVEVLFMDPANAGQINGIRAKSKSGGDWDMVVITGRIYRSDPPSAAAKNYHLLLKNTLGITAPAQP